MVKEGICKSVLKKRPPRGGRGGLDEFFLPDLEALELNFQTIDDYWCERLES
jgi:hypothetical protein